MERWRPRTVQVNKCLSQERIQPSELVNVLTLVMLATRKGNDFLVFAGCSFVVCLNLL